MILNYLQIALRNLLKQRTLAFINVFGLSLGIACFCLCALLAINELSFDKFHKNAANIFRFYADWKPNGNGKQYLQWASYDGPTGTTIGEAMKRDLPDVVEYVRLQLPWGDNLIRTEKNSIRAQVTYADPSFFSVFDFPLKFGNATSALQKKNDVVLTESKANELFGTNDVLGRTIEISIGAKFMPFTVSGVAEDVPSNSTIRFDVLGNFGFAYEQGEHSFLIGSNWHPLVIQTYLQLVPGSELPADAKAWNRFLKAFDPGVLDVMKSTGTSEPPVSLKLQPLLSIHTDTWFHDERFSDFGVIDLKTIWMLMAIASGILLIACINFTTLSIGRSADRSKEVGIRKAIGGQKRQIIYQFLLESTLLSFASGIMGLLLAYLALPFFNQLSDEQMYFSSLLNLKMMCTLTLLIIIVGLLAGSYPALVLSNFKPIEVLKNKIRISGSNVFTRSLVTIQFSLSIVLIVATIIILQQANYLVSKDPGFRKENVIVVDASETNPNKIFRPFKQSLSNQSGILGVASASAGLGAGHDLLGYSDNNFSTDINIIDADYIDVLGMELLVGKNFELGQGTDSLKPMKLKPMIINETMMKSFGWNFQNAVGQEIKNFQGGSALVIGVVKNFSYRSLREGVRNQAFITAKEEGYNNFYVRIAPGNPAYAIAAMKKAWDKAMPGIPMKYSFVDQDVNSFYKSELTWSGIIAWAGGISIFLACMGLLGLATLAAINRTKEIGVRKVLGAQVPGIVMLISRDFLKLIFISFVIGSPVAWILMNNWLQYYANRISISWTTFLFTGLVVLVIAFVVISFHTIKAAVANPVASLKTE